MGVGLHAVGVVYGVAAGVAFVWSFMFIRRLVYLCIICKCLVGMEKATIGEYAKDFSYLLAVEPLRLRYPRITWRLLALSLA